MSVKLEKRKIPDLEIPVMHSVTLKLTNGSEIQVLSSLKKDKEKGFIKGELDSANNKIYVALRDSGEIKTKYVDHASQNFEKRFGSFDSFDDSDE